MNNPTSITPSKSSSKPVSLFPGTLRTLFLSQNNNEIKNTTKNTTKQFKYKFKLLKKQHSTAKNLELCGLVCAVFDRILKSNIHNEGIKMGVDDILDLLKQDCETYYDDEQEEFAVWEVLKEMYITLLQLKNELWDDDFKENFVVAL